MHRSRLAGQGRRGCSVVAWLSISWRPGFHCLVWPVETFPLVGYGAWSLPARAGSCLSGGPARPEGSGRCLRARRVRRRVFRSRLLSLAVAAPVGPERCALALASLFLLSGSMAKDVPAPSTLQCACAGGAASPSRPAIARPVVGEQVHLSDRSRPAVGLVQPRPCLYAYH